MEARVPRSESHVAQRSRRDKLRVAGHHLEEFPSNLGQPMLYSGVMLPSDAVDCSSALNAQLMHRDAMLRQPAAGVSPSSQLIVSSEDAASLRVYGDAHNFDSLRRLSPHYATNYWAAYNSSGSTNENNQNPIFIREVLPADFKPGNPPVHYLIRNDSLSRYQDSSVEICSQDSHKHHGNADGFPSKCYQEDTLQEVVSSEFNAGGELALLPAYGREMNSLPCNGVVDWNHNASEVSCRRGIGDASSQGLSLTLSSNPSSSMLMTRNDQDSEVFNTGYSDNLVAKSSVSGKKPGKPLHEITGVSTYSAQWNTGPLGPFTGYATILKSSKFLKVTQDLLDDLCRVNSAKPVEMHVMLERISGETYMSSSGGGSSSSSSVPSEDQQKRATLLLMQDEVCRRYKQYCQQMQMVVSSFETVAGLTAATPYISLALKTVARNFRCLKNAISNQLRNARRSSGDDLSSPHNNGPSNSKGDLNSSKMALASQGFTKMRSVGANMAYLDAHNHVWRPQRGLPERAVAILRAWLFDHFLHPYPTDTDKHMLATQTGLSRNQVSNWFINARVRLWKPMVEEIHALETKRLAEPIPNSAPNRQASSIEVSSQRETMDHQPSSPRRLDHHRMASIAAAEQMQCSGSGLNVTEQWNQELCSRLEGRLPVSSEGPLLGLMRYPQGGIEFGGIGAVSLSLGLRHNSQRQDSELRQQFGGEMMRDYVG